MGESESAGLSFYQRGSLSLTHTDVNVLSSSLCPSIRSTCTPWQKSRPSPLALSLSRLLSSLPRKSVAHASQLETGTLAPLGVG